MRSAPSVVYPVGRCAFHAWLLVALGCASAAAGIVLLVVSDLSHSGVSGWIFRCAGAVSWLLWASWASLTWVRSPTGTLRWEPGGGDDEIQGGWTWRDGGEGEPTVLNAVECALDLQDRVLLSIRGGGRNPWWLWVERSSFPTRWHDLRRALGANRAWR